MGKKKFIKEYIEPIVIAILIALFIRAFIVQAFKIPSSSMEPTLLVGDYLLVNKFIYGVRIPYSNNLANFSNTKNQKEAISSFSYFQKIGKKILSKESSERKGKK